MLPRGVLAPIRGGCGRAVVRLLATSLVVFQLLFVLWLQPTAPAPAETLLVDEMDTKARMDCKTIPTSWDEGLGSTSWLAVVL